MEMALSTGLPSRMAGFIRNSFGAISRAASPNPRPTGDSDATTQSFTEPSVAATQDSLTRPLSDLSIASSG